MFREFEESLQLQLPNEWKTDQQIRESGLRHHVGLSKLLASDSYGPGVQLHPSNLGHLVRFDMGSKLKAVGSAVRLHASDIALDCVEIDNQCGSVNRNAQHDSLLRFDLGHHRQKLLWRHWGFWVSIRSSIDFRIRSEGPTVLRKCRAEHSRLLPCLTRGVPAQPSPRLLSGPVSRGKRFPTSS